MSNKPSLKELGYRFNQKGELRSINENAPFVFTNQTDYEKVGDAMTTELYGMLQSVCGLKKIDVPVKVDDKNGATVDFCGFVFASPEFQVKSTVLLLIHGSGAVRPGQWSRRLILNESLEVGSQILYIRRALANDWGVVVCSTNTDEEFYDYPRHHLCSVYEQLLKDSTIQRFFVVAHSRGGPDIARALPHFKNENRFEVVCLTDSAVLFDSRCSPEEEAIAGTVFINWKADSKLQATAVADEDVLGVYSRVHQVYAGTTEHERSSYTAFDSVFHVLEHWKGPNNLPTLLVEASGLTSVGVMES